MLQSLTGGLTGSLALLCITKQNMIYPVPLNTEHDKCSCMCNNINSIIVLFQIGSSSSTIYIHLQERQNLVSYWLYWYPSINSLGVIVKKKCMYD